MSDGFTILVRREGCYSSILVKSLEVPFFIDNVEFVALPMESDWWGFYDWLRSSKGEVIGVRLRLDDDFEFGDRLSYWKDFSSNGVLDLSGGLSFYFKTPAEFDVNLSNDCDFGGNFLFLSRDGDVAVSFNSPSTMMD